MAGRRQKTLVPKQESTLPRFKVKPSEDFPGWLLVTCPKDRCGDKPFIVHKATWLAKRLVDASHDLKARGFEKVEIVGRCCPYCSKVSQP